MKQLFLSLQDILKKMAYILNKRQKISCVVVFAMTMIGVALETLGISIILPVVQAMLYPEQLMKNRWIVSAVRLLDIKEEFQIVIFVACVAIMIYLIKNIYLIVLSYVRSKFSSNVQRELGVYMMCSYLKRGYPYFLRVSAHKMHRGITGDVAGVYTIVNNGFRFAAEVFTVIAIGIYILITDVLMSLSILLIAGISVTLTFFLCKNKMKMLGERFRKYDTEMKNCSYQTFHGIKEVLVMNKQEYFVEEYAEACKEQQKAMVLQNVLAESPAYIFEAVCVIAMIVAVVLRIFIDGGDSEFVSNVAIIAVAAFRIMPSLGRISNYANVIMFNIPAMNATYANLQEANKNECIIEARNNEGEEFKNHCFENELKLVNITWRYEGSDKDVIQKLNLTVKKGESIALIGESGAGKSTVADIILGLFRPSEGAVYMDGIDIRNIPQTWCKIIGYVPQAVYILDASIRKNVAYGVREDDINDNLVWQALEQAQLKPFVESLPEKLDTILGERGVRFSGGQRQRIAIARALYYNPEILILDEATSALDNKTEEGIMEAIEYLIGRKTLIIVAHRLSTIKQCDYIYEIKDGQAIQRKKEEVL